MKIVNISGGLGNQMFQYAFACALKKQFPDEQVMIDTHHYHSLFFKRFHGINLHNGYEIDKVFVNANLPVARLRDIVKVSYYMPNYVLSRMVRKFLPLRKTELIPSYEYTYSFVDGSFTEGDKYYEGFWQCIDYFKYIRKDLIQAFAHPTPNAYNKELMREIGLQSSVGIHVRRGDYLAEPEYSGICDIEYYAKALKQLMSTERDYVFYIFSNDMAWCKERLLPLMKGHRTVCVTENRGKDSCWDMFLMTYCKDLIIANSSFSWWGAFLNQQGGRIYAPKPWLRRDCEQNLYADGWIKIGQLTE